MMNNEMIINIAVGVMVGLLFGSLAAFLNYRISKHYIEKNRNSGGRDGMLSVMGVNFVRMLVNAVALAAVFFLRNILPWPFTAVMIGTALGLSAVSALLILHLSRSNKQS